MPLEVGEQIGPYEVLAPLARGGMGELYRARDPRLRREVALKMLPDASAHDADSLRRFDRETHAVAALNHPNILAIHDSGTFRSIPYAVTELLQGETVEERLRAGPLNTARAVEIACQIADGLAAAHARGIVHRDIKPDNIFLTNEGRAKILDFGIARIEQPLNSGDITSVGSRRGSSSQFLIGTAGYMSPEHVRGKTVDARSDIFALGATFYEMLTGRRAFMRDSPVETLGAVLRDDPRKHAEAAKIPDELKPIRVPLPRKGSRGPLPVRAGPAARSALPPGRAAAPGRRARHLPLRAALEAPPHPRVDSRGHRHRALRRRALRRGVLGARPDGRRQRQLHGISSWLTGMRAPK